MRYTACNNENNGYACNMSKTFFQAGESFSMGAKPSLSDGRGHHMIRYAEIIL